MRKFETLERRDVLSSIPLFSGFNRRLDDGRVHELDECYIANPNYGGSSLGGWAESHYKEAQQTTRLEGLPQQRPEAEIVLGDAVYFFYDRHQLLIGLPSGGVGQEIWKVTCDEVTRVADIGRYGGGGGRWEVKAAVDYLYFFADEDYLTRDGEFRESQVSFVPGDYELWRTNGTTEGTGPTSLIDGLTRLHHVEALADTGKTLFAGETEEGSSIWLVDTDEQTSELAVSDWDGELLVTGEGSFFYTVATAEEGVVGLRVGDINTPHLRTVFTGPVQSLTEIEDGVYFVSDRELQRVGDGEVERVASASSILGATSSTLLIQSPEGQFLVGGGDAPSEPLQTADQFFASDDNKFYFAAMTRQKELFADPTNPTGAAIDNAIKIVTHAIEVVQVGEDGNFSRVGTVEFSDEYGALLVTTDTIGIQTVRDGVVVKLWHEDEGASRRWITHHHLSIADPLSERLPGDINLDDVVDFRDFLQFAEEFKVRTFADDSRWLDGDFSGDRKVNFADFLLLAHNYGRKIS